MKMIFIPSILLVSLTVLWMTGCGGQPEESLPVKSPSDPKYVKCWVHVNHQGSDPTFRNPFDQIRGPIALSTLKNLSGTQHADWTGKIDGLKVGSTARVTVWSAEHFKGTRRVFEPDQEVKSIRAESLSGIGSLKIEYTGP